jgi:hypothetical protein
MPTATDAAARPIADNTNTKAHFRALNEVLTVRERGAYLCAYLSILTRFTAPFELLSYTRDLMTLGADESPRPISKEVMAHVRALAVIYAEERDVRRAIERAQRESAYEPTAV